MEIVLIINVFTQSNKVGLTYTKSFESNIIPTKDNIILDPIFAEGKVITKVAIDYHLNKCFTYLEGKKMPDGSLDGHVQEVAKLHEWVIYNEE